MNIQLPITVSIDDQHIINQRIQEFKAFKTKGNEDWFSELCFCILTANSQAKKAIAIQENLGINGFVTKTEKELAAAIRSHNHRFHNNKAKFIVHARQYLNIKDILSSMTSIQARDFLATTINGLGYKESSHFLRNVGYEDVAIIDRHIIRFLAQYKFIPTIPKTITKKLYLEYENILKAFGIPLNSLDLIIWNHMTGQILK